MRIRVRAGRWSLSWTRTNADSSSPASVAPVVRCASSHTYQIERPEPTVSLGLRHHIDRLIRREQHRHRRVVFGGGRPSGPRISGLVVAGNARSTMEMSSSGVPRRLLARWSLQTAGFVSRNAASYDHSRRDWDNKHRDETLTHPPTRNARSAAITAGPISSRSPSRRSRAGERSSSCGFNP